MRASVQTRPGLTGTKPFLLFCKRPSLTPQSWATCFRPLILPAKCQPHPASQAGSVHAGLFLTARVTTDGTWLTTHTGICTP